MTENGTTQAIQFLQDKISGEDKARDQRAVNTLLELSKFRPRKQEQSDNPLVREMMKTLDSERR